MKPPNTVEAAQPIAAERFAFADEAPPGPARGRLDRARHSEQPILGLLVGLRSLHPAAAMPGPDQRARSSTESMGMTPQARPQPEQEGAVRITRPGQAAGGTA